MQSRELCPISGVNGQLLLAQNRLALNAALVLLWEYPFSFQKYPSFDNKLCGHCNYYSSVLFSPPLSSSSLSLFFSSPSNSPSLSIFPATKDI